MSTLVMKFGGAAVATPEQFGHIADLIISRKAEYKNIIVVVSAMGGTTDQLIELGKKVHPSPPQREYDMLISVGERISMSLLAMALCLKNCDAVSFTGSQSGILTNRKHSEARITQVRPERLLNALSENKIVIVAGFQGVSDQKEITTLGRGGSDTSAVALGIALKASKIEFYKDVLGVFEEDPKINKAANFYSHLTYCDALEIICRGSKILHARAIHLAEKNGIVLHVRSFIPSFLTHSGTTISQSGRSIRENPVYEEENSEKPPFEQRESYA